MLNSNDWRLLLSFHYLMLSLSQANKQKRTPTIAKQKNVHETVECDYKMVKQNNYFIHKKRILVAKIKCNER